MYALFYVLNRSEILPEIIAELQKVDVQGVSILDGIGVGKPPRANSHPRIGGLLNAVLERQHYNKIIFSIIKTRETLDDAIERIDKVVGGLARHNHGILFTFNLRDVYGGFR